MIEDLVTAGSAHEDSCPICSRELKKPHRCKTLFDVKVCKKCRNGFASRRQVAYIIDVLLWWAIVTAVWYLLGLMVRTQPASTAFSGTLFGSEQPLTGWDSLQRIADLVGRWLILPMVFCMKDGFGGRSPGKALMRVRVIDSDTREPIGFLRSLKRNMPLLIPLVGFVGIVLTMMKGKRWGDGWANTQLVWDKHEHKVPFDLRGILCMTCGYNLTGNVSGRCPECGTEFAVRKSSEL